MTARDRACGQILRFRELWVRRRTPRPNHAITASKLADLRDRGVITAEEFEREKAKIPA